MTSIRKILPCLAEPVTSSGQRREEQIVLEGTALLPLMLDLSYGKCSVLYMSNLADAFQHHGDLDPIPIKEIFLLNFNQDSSAFIYYLP